MNAEHDIKRLSDDELKQRWKYQQSPGPHTMGIGTCRVCGGDSRGGEWFCRRCLEAEIARRNGEGDEP